MKRKNMRSEITKDKEFYILSRSIDNADRCRVVEVLDRCFKVKTNNKQIYEADESVELFSVSPKGRFYFETIVKEVNDDIISIWFPLVLKHLQRREYTRVAQTGAAVIQNGEGSINAEMIDIGPGGLKAAADVQLELLRLYKISISIDNKTISADFQPIRIESSAKGFITSGRFENIGNYDKIVLVQYCFRKQIEQRAL